MRKFIISATVAIVAAVSFAAPSQAGNYGYGHKSYGHKSYSYGHKSYGQKHYGYKSHYKSYGHAKRWNPYGGKVVIKFGYDNY
jgi:hypothetical protein